MTLAERGNNLNLHITYKDLTEEGKENSGQKEKPDDDIYSKAMKDMMPRPVFLWGKAVQNSLGMLRQLYMYLFAYYFSWLETLELFLISYLTFTRHLIAW